MLKRYQGENLYRTTLTDTIDPISAPNGTNDMDIFTIEVSVAPKNTKGRIIVDFTDNSKRDVIYFHDRTGTTLKYYRKDRDLLGLGVYAAQHEDDAPVQINDVAEWINYLFANQDDFGYIKDMGGNKCQILGGDLDYGSGGVITISDSAIGTLIDGTNYAVFNTILGQLEFTDTYVYGTGKVLLGIITVTAGDIVSITDKRYRDLFGNKPVLNDLSDSGGLLAYKGIPIGTIGGDVETWTIVNEITGTYVANLGEYIRCKYITDITTIVLPSSEAANVGARVCIAKKNSSGKYVLIQPQSLQSIDGFGSSLQISQNNTSVTLVSGGDGTRSIE